MTKPDRDYDDILSRVLRSTMDPIEPAGDGLAKIQRRIAEPWLKRQVSLIRMELSALGWLLAVRSEPFRTGVRSRFAGFGTRSSRRRAAPGGARAAWATSRRYDTSRRSARAGDTGLRRWLGPTMAWLRPALAVAGAVVIVVAGVFALGQVRTDLIGAASQGTSSGPSGQNGGTGVPATKHHSHLTTPRSGPGGSRSRGHKPGSKPVHKTGPKTVPSCSPTVAPSPSASAGGPGPTPSPSPSPTSSPTSSPTPTPTTSPTSSPPVFGPNGGGTSSASPEPESAAPKAKAGDMAAVRGSACATVDGRARRFT